MAPVFQTGTAPTTGLLGFRQLLGVIGGSKMTISMANSCKKLPLIQNSDWILYLREITSQFFHEEFNAKRFSLFQVWEMYNRNDNSWLYLERNSRWVLLVKELVSGKRTLGWCNTYYIWYFTWKMRWQVNAKAFSSIGMTFPQHLLLSSSVSASWCRKDGCAIIPARI